MRLPFGAAAPLRSLSLRARLNLFISALFALVLALGALLVVRNAQYAVHEELRATSNLTLQLVEAALDGAREADPAERLQLLRQITALDATRHLDIELVMPDGTVHSAAHGGEPRPTGAAPRWFARWVEPEPLQYTRALPALGHGQIVLRPDPTDEIAEAWEEARDLLALVLLVLVVANGLVFFTFGRALRPVETILAALDGIERGQYGRRLPEFALPELARIAQKFNRVAQRLAHSEAENRLLAQRSLAVQEEERQRLARELHDELGQCLTAIRADAASISRRSRSIAPEVHERAQAILAVAGRVQEVVRGMMRRLRPVMLDELGLTATLREALEEWQARRPEVACRFSSPPRLGELGAECEITVYRVVQECLTNIARHAQCRSVGVEIRQVAAPGGGDAIEVRVTDDGCGFRADAPRGGLGLLGMAERARALHGELTVASAPGAGTSVTLRLPLRRAAIEAAP
jgi:two-component system, NarL family, sensor histidine kinase UhpB